MKILSLFLFFALFKKQCDAQYFWQITDLVKLRSINEADKELSKFGFSYSKSETIPNQSTSVVYFTKTDYEKGFSLTVGVFKADSLKEGLTVQVITYTDAIFKLYKKELEDYSLTKLEKEEVKGDTYTRTYTKTGNLYVFTATRSNDGRSLYVISITNISDYKLKRIK